MTRRGSKRRDARSPKACLIEAEQLIHDAMVEMMRRGDDTSQLNIAARTVGAVIKRIES